MSRSLMVFIAALPLLVGCYTIHDTVRLRHSREFGCPEAQVRTQSLGGGGYRAGGCGVRAIYSCITENDGDHLCVQERRED